MRWLKSAAAVHLAVRLMHVGSAFTAAFSIPVSNTALHVMSTASSAQLGRNRCARQLLSLEGIGDVSQKDLVKGLRYVRTRRRSCELYLRCPRSTSGKHHLVRKEF